MNVAITLPADAALFAMDLTMELGIAFDAISSDILATEFVAECANGWVLCVSHTDTSGATATFALDEIRIPVYVNRSTELDASDVAKIARAITSRAKRSNIAFA